MKRSDERIAENRVKWHVLGPHWLGNSASANFPKEINQFVWHEATSKKRAKRWLEKHFSTWATPKSRQSEFSVRKA